MLNNKIKKTMEKFYLKNGKEVQIGDIIIATSKKESPNFTETSTKYIEVTEDILPELLDDGIIISKSEKPVENTTKPKKKTK